jgi:hypothetical protein
MDSEIQSKWFLQSKTIIGLIVGLLATFLPQFGISFTADSASQLNSAIDGILQGIGMVLVIWGRVSATQPLRLTPGKPTTGSGGDGTTASQSDTGSSQSGNSNVAQRVLQSIASLFRPARSVAAACALSIIAACAITNTDGATANLTPAQSLYNIKSQFAVYVKAAADYSSQPFCSATVLTACAQPKVVVSLDNAASKVAAAINTASPVILGLKPGTADAQQNALAIAQGALQVLITLEAASIATKGA